MPQAVARLITCAQGRITREIRGFPAYLRAAGYYCTNNSKTDYNAPVNIKDAWDECSNKAHYRNRPKAAPFFAVFNHEVTHESQVFPQAIRKYPPIAHPTDPAKVVLPAYHPDTPELRRNRANYYDLMNRMDTQIGRKIAQLEEEGLLDDTIIFYYGDNGGVLPRSKRFCYESGLHVPLIIRFPRKFQDLAPAAAGSHIESPVSFVDFAPTVLSLVGIDIPKHMEGHAFAGKQNAGAQQYAFCFRNRMDDRYDFVRTARDKQYRYIRNYSPHVIWGQHVQYMWQQTGVKVWEQLHKEGKLNAQQDLFWREKPEEELYELASDPSEVKNLAASPEHQQVVNRMRAALEEHMLRTRDNGFIPEGSPLEGYAQGRDASAYPLERILPLANLAIKRDPANLLKLIEAMSDANECMRYWGALGCVMLREKLRRPAMAWASAWAIPPAPFAWWPPKPCAGSASWTRALGRLRNVCGMPTHSCAFRRPMRWTISAPRPSPRCRPSKRPAPTTTTTSAAPPATPPPF